MVERTVRDREAGGSNPLAPTNPYEQTRTSWRTDEDDKHPVTPGEVLPARELYADMLLEAGHHDESLEQYRHVLSSSPNRLNALLGAARKAAGLGDVDLERRHRGLARDQTHSGNQTRNGLTKAP